MDAGEAIRAHGELIKARIATFKTLSNGERDEVFSRVFVQPGEGPPRPPKKREES